MKIEDDIYSLTIQDELSGEDYQYDNLTFGALHYLLNLISGDELPRDKLLKQMQKGKSDKDGLIYHGKNKKTDLVLPVHKKNKKN